MTDLKATVLVVDDNQDIREVLDLLLQSEGYNTLQADSGKTAVELIATQHIDLVLLDIIMPEMDGYQVARYIRENPATKRLPIIMISGRNEDIDEALGLELGADDYIRKPFEPLLVRARVKACLRRTLPETPDKMTFGKLVIDRNERSARLNSQELELSSAEFDLLWLLAVNAGQILSREEILQSTRGLEYDGINRSIDMRISRLRKLLNDDPESPQFIKSVRSKGYLFSGRAMEQG